MKYCSNCGTPLTDEDNYCPCCGTKLRESMENSQNANVYNAQNTNTFNSQNSVNNEDPFADLDNSATNASVNNTNTDNTSESAKSEPEPDYNEHASTITKVLSFFSPLVGLILYCYWSSKYKVKAREVGKMAIIGYIVSMIVGFFFGFVYRFLYGLTDVVPQIVGLIG